MNLNKVKSEIIDIYNEYLSYYSESLEVYPNSTYYNTTCVRRNIYEIVDNLIFKSASQERSFSTWLSGFLNRI